MDLVRHTIRTVFMHMSIREMFVPGQADFRAPESMDIPLSYALWPVVCRSFAAVKRFQCPHCCVDCKMHALHDIKGFNPLVHEASTLPGRL